MAGLGNLGSVSVQYRSTDWSLIGSALVLVAIQQWHQGVIH